MRSIGRKLRRVGDHRVHGTGNGRRGVLYSSMAPRSPAIAILNRLIRRASNWQLPRHAGSYAAGGFLAACLGYGVVLGDHIAAFGAGIAEAGGRAATSAGLGVETVLISGHQQTRERDVVAALHLDEATSLMTLDPFAARDRLSQLPWVKSATVQKLFPNTLKIDLVEREAFALWQVGGMVQMIDRNGEAIGALTDEKFAGLPLVAGYGANRAAAELVDMIAPHPRIAARFRAAVRVADRRWNIKLENGVDVRLPEDDPAGAIAELARMDEERELLARDIVSVDLRLADRVVVRLSDSAALQRKASHGPGGRSTRSGADT